MDCVTTFTENSVQFLSAVACSLPGNQALNILKSSHLTKCQTLTEDSIFNLPRRFTNNTSRCPRCCLSYESGNATYRVTPHSKLSQFARKVLRYHEQGRNLTNYQQKYLKRLLSKGESVTANNTLIIQCGFCKNRLKQKMNKPQCSADATPSKSESVIVRSRKKKKKKDSFSGLNKEAVLSANSTPKIKSISGGRFTPLDATPNSNSCLKTMQKKKLAFQDRTESAPKKKNVNQMKKLQSILNSSSKQKKSASSVLKQFLTSI